MNAAIGNMAIMFGAMQVAKRIPFDENPEYVLYARLVYAASQLACLAVFYYCSIQVKKANDLTVLKYVNAKNPMVRVCACAAAANEAVTGAWGACHHDAPRL